MKKLGLLVFAIAVVSSFAAVWAITGKTIVAPSFAFYTRIEGSGVSATEKREVAAFTGVKASGAVKVEIVAGKDFSVELTGDDNILPFIKTKVRGGVLHIDRTGKRRDLRMKTPLVARISLPHLNNLNISGANFATVANVNSDDLKIKIGGASTIEIAGEARNLRADVSGASELRAENLQTRRANVEANGASKVFVFAADSLDAEASGASTIRYAGNPASVSEDSSGASSIQAD